jgi:hypothetical protein
MSCKEGFWPGTWCFAQLAYPFAQLACPSYEPGPEVQSEDQEGGVVGEWQVRDKQWISPMLSFLLPQNAWTSTRTCINQRKHRNQSSGFWEWTCLIRIHSLSCQVLLGDWVTSHRAVSHEQGTPSPGSWRRGPAQKTKSCKLGYSTHFGKLMPCPCPHATVCPSHQGILWEAWGSQILQVAEVLGSVEQQCNHISWRLWQSRKHPVSETSQVDQFDMRCDPVGKSNLHYVKKMLRKCLWSDGSTLARGEYTGLWAVCSWESECLTYAWRELGERARMTRLVCGSVTSSVGEVEGLDPETTVLWVWAGNAVTRKKGKRGKRDSETLWVCEIEIETGPGTELGWGGRRKGKRESGGQSKSWSISQSISTS